MTVGDAVTPSRMNTSEKLRLAARSRIDRGQRSYLFYLSRYYAAIENGVDDIYAKHSFFHCVQFGIENADTKAYCKTAAESLAVYGTYNMRCGRVVFQHLVKLLEARKVMNPDASDRPLDLARSLLEHGAHSEEYYAALRPYLEELRGDPTSEERAMKALATFDKSKNQYFRTVMQDPFRELFPPDLLVPYPNDFEVHSRPYAPLVPRGPIAAPDVIKRDLPPVIPLVQGPENDPHDVSHLRAAIEAIQARAEARKRRRERDVVVID